MLQMSRSNSTYQLKSVPRKSKDEEASMVLQYREAINEEYKTDDTRALTNVIFTYFLQCYGRYCWKRYANCSGVVKYDDYQMMIVDVLHKSLMGFDPDKGWAFMTYMSRAIDNEIGMYYRRMKSRVLDMYNTVSLDDALHIDQDGNPLTWMEVVDSMYNQHLEDPFKGNVVEEIMEIGYEVIDRRDMGVKSAEDRKTIFKLYMEDGWTQLEIANHLNLSQSYVSRLIKKHRQKWTTALASKKIIFVNEEGYVSLAGGR